MCSLTHSNLRSSVFFFSEKMGKKIQLYFFISQEKFTFHSLNFSGGAFIKNRGKSYIFSEIPFLTPFYVVFLFFRDLYFFSLDFFFLEKFKPHSLTHFKRVYFSEKKKYSIFTHSLDFVKNVTKINFSKK